MGRKSSTQNSAKISVSVDQDNIISAEDPEEATSSTDDAEDSGPDSDMLEQNDLSNVPMGELLELRQKLPQKLFNKAVFPGVAAPASSKGVDAIKKKRQKKAPRVESTKRRNVTPRPIFSDDEETKVERFDPRFSERCGEFSQHHFSENYGFLQQLHNKELQELKTEFKKVKGSDPIKAAQIKKTIKSMVQIFRFEQFKSLRTLQENRMKTEKEKDDERNRIRELRKQNMERMKKGQKPFYVKKSELKREKLERQYGELKKAGKLERYMKRKEKRKANKSSDF